LWIHLVSPAVNAAFKVDHVVETFTFKEQRNGTAANAMMADYDGFPVPVQRFHGALYLAHWNQFRTLYVTGLVFPGFPNVEQQRRCVALLEMML
jgi:hypothetical protein